MNGWAEKRTHSKLDDSSVWHAPIVIQNNNFTLSFASKGTRIYRMKNNKKLYHFIMLKWQQLHSVDEWKKKKKSFGKMEMERHLCVSLELFTFLHKVFGT